MSIIKRRRFIFLVLGALLVMTSIGIAFAFFLPNPAIAKAREASVDLLADAADPEAMEKAVGHLGIIFHLDDGSWIAIRYVDRHHGDFWSSAVALDSAGGWYESEEHFCGQFMIYRRQWDRTLELLTNPNTTLAEKKWWIETCPLEPASVREVEESANLQSARRNLLKLGFRPAIRERIAKMSGPWPEKAETKRTAIQRLVK